MNRTAISSLPFALLVLFASVAHGHGWMLGSPSTPGMAPRSAATMAFDDTRGRAVLFGGNDASAFYNDTWEYDGIGWQPGPLPPPALQPRMDSAMAYDPTIGKIVLFGGYGGSGALNDTWLYDGASWSPGPLAPPALTPRASHAMADDPRRGRIVLFGGHDGTTFYSDTWEYDGTLQWLAGPSAPATLTPRARGAMGFDATRGVMVLFGGVDGSAVYNESWDYDGATWAPGPFAPAGLSPRWGFAMASDVPRGRLVIFGGFTTGPSTETWELSGSSWIQGRGVPSSMPPRVDATMAYDTWRRQVVLYGGDQDFSAFYGDTWTYQPTTALLAGAGFGDPNPNRVTIFEPSGEAAGVDFMAYGAGRYGVNVSAGDLDGDKQDEIVTGPGPGAVFGPQVRAFESDSSPIGKINYFAYGTLRYGANVVSQNFDTDGYAEIVSGAGPGAVFGPHVRGWNYDGVAVSPSARINFFAYGTLRYGVNVGGSDVDGDFIDEVLTGAGPGVMFGPQVRGWNTDGGPTTAISTINFVAFGVPQFGVNVAGGDVDRDNFGEIACSPGPGSSIPTIFRGFNFDAFALTALPGFDITPYATTYGGRVGIGDVVGDEGEDLLPGPGPDPTAGALVAPYAYMSGSLSPEGPLVTAFPYAFGVNATAGWLGF